MRFLILLVTILLSALVTASTLLSDWQERSFVGNTHYRIENIEGSSVIRGDALASASMLYREQRIDLGQVPVLTWRWKVAGTYGELNEQTKAGDDYPARLYVVVKTGPFPWQTLAINYVWSSNARKGEVWPNAFTANAMMVVLRSGDDEVGLWQQERRNVVVDFKKLFNVDVTHLDGYAIMVDGDNTGSRGTAWFADIAFMMN